MMGPAASAVAETTSHKSLDVTSDDWTTGKTRGKEGEWEQWRNGRRERVVGPWRRRREGGGLAPPGGGGGRGWLDDDDGVLRHGWNREF